MVLGVSSQSLPAERQAETYPPLQMTQREAVALAHFIVQKRLDEAS